MLLTILGCLGPDFSSPASCALHRLGGLAGEPASRRGLASGQPGASRLSWWTGVGDRSGASQPVAQPTAVRRGCRSRAPSGREGSLGLERALCGA